MKKVSKLSHGVWSEVSDKKNVLEEIKNGKRTGRFVEKINLKVSENNKMEVYNNYINKHQNIIVFYDPETFELTLYKRKSNK